MDSLLNNPIIYVYGILLLAFFYFYRSARNSLWKFYKIQMKKKRKLKAPKSQVSLPEIRTESFFMHICLYV